jgi:hypothetical protein
MMSTIGRDTRLAARLCSPQESLLGGSSSAQRRSAGRMMAPGRAPPEELLIGRDGAIANARLLLLQGAWLAAGGGVRKTLTLDVDGGFISSAAFFDSS